jgi:hypothetical protein
MRNILHRWFSVLDVFSDTVAIGAFLLWAAATVTTWRAMFLSYLGSMPLPQRFVVLLLIEAALAYSTGSVFRRLKATLRHNVIYAHPLGFLAMLAICAISALISVSTISSALFNDQVKGFPNWLLLMGTVYLAFFLRSWFIHLHLSEVSRNPNEDRYAQLTQAICFAVVYLGTLL